MAVSADNKMSAEPIGIVISRGKRDEPTPAFVAYIWGPAPDDEASSTEPKAA
jgi:hypothetical protein